MDTFEKKYNEALARAKAAIDVAADKDLVKGVSATIFPELRESEDEKIRKDLIYDIERLPMQGVLTHRPTSEYIAYLEKQKEQKPDIEVSANNDYSYAFGYEKGLRDGRMEQKPVECSDCAKHLEGYISGRVDAEKKLLDEYGIFIMPEGELRMKPRWKPSEEQMEAFRGYIEDFQARAEAAVGGWNNFDVMIRLYEQLKKL